MTPLPSPLNSRGGFCRNGGAEHLSMLPASFKAQTRAGGLSSVGLQCRRTSSCWCAYLIRRARSVALCGVSSSWACEYRYWSRRSINVRIPTQRVQCGFVVGRKSAVRGKKLIKPPMVTHTRVPVHLKSGRSPTARFKNNCSLRVQSRNTPCKCLGGPTPGLHWTHHKTNLRLPSVYLHPLTEG